MRIASIEAFKPRVSGHTRQENLEFGTCRCGRTVKVCSREFGGIQLGVEESILRIRKLPVESRQADLQGFGGAFLVATGDLQDLLQILLLLVAEKALQ